jgi:hypothetical protein
MHSAGVSQATAAGKVSGANCTLLNDTLERTWKETVVAGFEVLSQHLTGAADEYYEKLESR